MCGISGLWARAGVDQDVVRAMNTTLVHRGPDDEGYYFDESVGLGHRRLSIIDIEHGRQPIPNEDGTVWIVFNGEIYNFLDLRRELQAAGHRFKTRTDTEVIVHLYEQHGVECVRHLQGMFAFAIWDRPKKRLFLARDHVGQKPLFFFHGDGVFMFASEIKALLRSGQIKPAMDTAAMSHLISLRYLPGMHTLFKGVRKLPAAHWMILEDGARSMSRYWQLEYRKKVTGTEEEVVGGLKTVLQQSVKSHLISDVPVGAFLSGGLDSGTITSMMALESPQRIQTFSIGVQEGDFNELPYARMVAGVYGTEHHEKVADTKLVGLLPRLIWHMDEIADPFGFGVYLVSQLAKSRVKVVLGGDGGDELFGGYDRYAGQRLVDYYCFLPAVLRRHVFPALMGLLPDSYGYNSTTQKLRWLNSMSLVSGGDRYAQSMAYLRFPQEAKEKLFSSSLRRQLNGEFDSTPEILQHFNASCAQEAIDKMLYTDMMTRMPDHLLMLVDHMTMAHSLEDRSPLLDRRVVEYAAAIPAALKVKGRRLKYVFRQVAKDFVPPQLLSRSKQGFSFPLAYWMKAELGNLLQFLFRRSRLAEEGYFRREYMFEMLDQHRRGQIDHNYRLWILLNLELWWHMYIDGVSLESLEDKIQEGLAAPESAPL